MEEAIKTLEEKISKLQKPVLIGISGFGGSGKSTFALSLGEKLKAPVVGVDSFAKHDIHKDYEFWEIIDYNRLSTEVIQPFLSDNHVIKYSNQDWKENNKETEIKHNGILIIEGIGLFRPELMKHFSLTIWIDCPIEEATSRGKRRNKEQHNTNHDEYWDGIWQKNDLQCFESFSPKESADFIVNHHQIGKIYIS
ncbi:AAA family ATPase [Candidatus Peregrinibacteria bacterium]|nr:MAG: AAA family ATPase [Candidatus Peregrinibacteria bacterium]